MLTVEENELVTRTDKGTPTGELFRRFWLPVALSEEIPVPDCPPARVRVLGEDLVAFRDSEGKVGLMEAYCPHRGAPLFFGRNEENGLRCVYHGWKFNIDGNCLDIPNTPEGESFRDKVQVLTYPAVDAGGMIFAYLGPPEKKPPLPGFGFFGLPSNHFAAWKIVSECNYLQSLEGGFDASHGAFLHSNLNPFDNPRARILGSLQQGNARVVGQYALAEPTDYGAFGATMRPSPDNTQTQVGTSQFVLPCFVPGNSGGGKMNLGYFRARIPVDDNNSMVYRCWWDEEAPLTQEYLNSMRNGEFFVPEMIPGTFKPKANRDNDYGVDRFMQKNYNFTGIKEFNLQDVAVIEDQRGSIMDRSQEKLVHADSMIIQVRRAIINAARELAEGKEPAILEHPEWFNIRPTQFRIPAGESVEAAVRERMDKLTSPAIPAFIQ